MAMAPWYEHAELLYAAVRKAAFVLRAPIDRVEVTSGKVRFWCETKILFWPITKKLTINYRYVDNPRRNPGAAPSLLFDGENTPRFSAQPRTNRAALPSWGEREELLNATISKATLCLRAEIDRIEVTSDQVLFWAGTTELAVAYQYLDKPSERLKCRGFLIDGEDYWECFKT
jgi:hypothetical protein